MTNLQRNKTSYVELAREIQKRRSTGLIKLKKEDDEEIQPIDHENKLKLISKEEALTSNYNKIANAFHKSEIMINSNVKIPALPKDFSES